MPVVRDMLGRTLHLPERPRRIVSLVPSQTELLADLGLEAAVVGITKFCVHPENWFRSKTRIGGTKDVKPERVAALQPDLIIANKEENVREQIEALQEIAPVWVSDIKVLDDALEMIRNIGWITGKADEALAIAKRIDDGISALSFRKRFTTVYGIWRAPWMWAGGDTFIHDILSRCGFDNVLADRLRYPAIELDDLKELDPELVLLSSEPYPFKEKHIAEVQAVLPGARIVLVDGELFSWYGSRLLHAPEYLAALLQSL
jgi:ABC-type Fe3+-hydroxamate transport system substrate-binding protein